MLEKRILAVVMVGAAALLLCFAIVKFALANAGMVRPSAQTKTDFFKTYSPAKTIAPFDLHLGGQTVEANGSTPGRGFVLQNRRIQQLVVIRPQDQPKLAKALREQVALELQKSSLTVLDQGSTSQDGYRFHYGTATTEGTVTIDPLRPDSKSSLSPSADRIAVVANIAIEEKWTRAKK